MLSLNRWLVLGAVAVAALQSPSVVFGQTGTIEGQVVLDGEIPKLAPKVAKGDPAARDAATCAAEEVPDESLVVDPATKGIANVIIYLKKKPAAMPAGFQPPEPKELVVDQK